MRGWRRPEGAGGGGGEGGRGKGKGGKGKAMSEEEAREAKEAKAAAAADAAAMKAKAEADAKAAAAAAAKKAAAEEAEAARQKQEQAEAARRAQAEADERQRAEAEAALLTAKIEMRQLNIDCVRPKDADLKGLDSSLKKNQAFIKKCTTIGEAARSGLLSELPKLNLSKFVEEVAGAIAEAKLKLTDLPATLQVCSLMHRTYATFEPALTPQLCKNALLTAPAPAKPGQPPAVPETDAERSARLSRKRSTLRLLFELHAVGVAPQAAPLLRVLKQVIAEDLASADPVHPNLLVLSNFAKYVAADPLVLSPAVRGDAESDAGDGPSCALVEADQRAIVSSMSDYYGKVAASAQLAYQQLRSVAKSNQKTLGIKGELTDEASAAYERAKKLHEKLVGGGTALAELLNTELPEMTEEEEEKVDKVQISMHGKGDDGGDESGGLFEDKETRAFYETLPDLLAVLPAVLFEEDKAGGGGGKGGADEEDGGDAAGFEALLQQLPGCTSRETVDEVASQLVCRGARSHRRKLVRALSSPPRSKPEVLPYYSRLAATMALCFRHVDTELVSLLKEEFGELAERNKPHDLELRLNNARYVGELVKFKLMKAETFFTCLKSALDAFDKGANALVACALLESCGRYLHRNRETTQRCEAMLEVLVKLRSVHRLPADLATQLENAVHACKPPERSAMVVEQLPPMHQYVRWLLHRHLSKNTVEHVIKQLRKLPWHGEGGAEVARWVYRATLDCGTVKYHTIQLLACVLSGLFRYQEAAVVRIVDGAIEAFRCAIERNDYREGQMRACLARLIGELYNYRLLDSAVIFRVLYWLVPEGAGVWGHVVPLMHVGAHAEPPTGNSGGAAAALPTSRALQHPQEPMADGPDDLSRLRLVCTLLDTCGQFFDKGSAKRRLDVYLVRLMAYLFCKAITVEMEFSLSDTFALVRKDLVRPSTYAAAIDGVAQMKEALAEDERKGEALAAELLRGGFGEGGGGADNEDEGEEQGGEEAADEEDMEQEGEEATEADAVDDELAEVERQLRELDMEEDEMGEGGGAGGGGGKDKDDENANLQAQVRREATQREVDDFEREMGAMLADSKKAAATKGLRPLPDAPKIPVGLLRAGGVGGGGSSGGGGAGGSSGGGGGGGSAGAGEAAGDALSLRVLTKRGTNKAGQAKVDAAEVLVPRNEALAKSVIKIDAQVAQEKQLLKRQILAAAADHDSQGPGYIAQIRQKDLDQGTAGGPRTKKW